MRIAVTGATGRLGQQVVEILAATGDHEVVAVSRRTPQAASAHVVTAAADYADLAALRVAFTGVDTLVFVSSDGEAVTVLHHHQNVIKAARAAGVGHIVALSGLDADLASPFCYAVTYAHTERLLRDTSGAVSIARASIYTEFLLDLVSTARNSGEIRLPAGDGAISLVSRTDVGHCLAALAQSPPTAGRLCEITGPQALDLHAVAELCTQRWQRPVSYVDITPADYQVELAQRGTEPWWSYAFTTMFDSVRQHRWAGVSNVVQELTGRGPLSLSEVLSSAS